MSGVSVSPLVSGDGGILPGMLVHQVPSGSAFTVTRAQANLVNNTQGVFVVVYSTTAPGGAVLADLSGRQRVLLETGLTPVNGQVLYLSDTVAGRATNVAPAIVVQIGTILDTSTYAGDNSVIAAVGGISTPNSPAAPFDLAFTYGGQDFGVQLPPGSFTGANPNFWLRPNSGFENPGLVYATPGQVWDYPCGNNYTRGTLYVFVYQCGLTGSGTNLETLSIIPTINGSDITAGTISVAQNETTISHNSAWQQVFGPDDRVGSRITVVDGAGSAYSSGAFRATFHLRLT